MKCPLIVEPTRYPSGQVNMDPIDCLGKDCEHWIEDMERCSAVVIAGGLMGLVACFDEVLKELRSSRRTFHCHDCALRVSMPASEDEAFPKGWIKVQHVDNRGIWLCESCMTSGRY